MFDGGAKKRDLRRGLPAPVRTRVPTSILTYFEHVNPQQGDGEGERGPTAAPVPAFFYPQIAAAGR